MRKPLVEEYISGAVLCGMVLLVFIQVAGRYLFQTSFSYTEEIVRYLFVWVTFVCAAAAVQHGGHVSLVGVINHLSPSVRSAAAWFRFTGAVLFAGILVYHGVRIVLLQFRTEQTTAALGAPMWIIGLAIPVSASLLIIRLIAGVLARRKVPR
jgi:TRAP-type C4-dicarboxylate transport system permease small subunit